MTPRRAAIFLLLGLTLLPGCKPLGFAARVFDSGEVDAAYPLPARPTLVLVDDPESIMSDPTLKSVLAQAIEMSVKENIKGVTFVPQQQLVDLQARTGVEYNKMAVNRIGINVQAEQVIQVWIEAISFNPQPGMVAPRATVRVKVVESGTGKRVFPAAKPGQEGNPEETYVTLSVSMGYTTLESDQGAAMAKVYRALMARIGVEVAELFYKHVPREAPATDL